MKDREERHQSQPIVKPIVPIFGPTNLTKPIWQLSYMYLNNPAAFSVYTDNMKITVFQDISLLMTNTSQNNVRIISLKVSMTSIPNFRFSA